MSTPDRPGPSRDSPPDHPHEPSATGLARDDASSSGESTTPSTPGETDGVGEKAVPSLPGPQVTETPSVAPDDTPLLVVGGGQVGRLLARRLYPGRPVHYIDSDATAVDRAARRHEATYVDDLTNGSAFAAVADDMGLTADVDVVVATSQDATNLLVAQHCRSAFDTARVLVVVADPRAHDVYPAAFERVCATTALTDAVVSTLSEPLSDEPR